MSNDKELPLYMKFRVEREDPTGKHKNCFYFVLDTDHDKFSVPALKAYAAACAKEYPILARDLEGLVRALEIKHDKISRTFKS